MASRTVVELIDDLDGGPASQTITFALDSNVYAIDLSEVNAKQLRADFERYVAVARRTKGTGGRGKTTGAPKGPRTGTSAARDERRQIRDWANANGYSVGDRGRVPQYIVEAYERAHSS